MTVNELIEKARTDFSKATHCKVDGITGFCKANGGWSVSLEVLERKAIPDSMDILGIYEVNLDSEGSFLSFERKRLRKRSDTNEQ